MKIFIPDLTHEFKKQGVVAFYSSLKMKPVFVKEAIAKQIRSIFCSPTEESYFFEACKDILKSPERLLAELKEAKILVEESVSTKEVIEWHGKTFTGNPYISIMYLIFTDRCNLGCRYCFVMNKFDGKISYGDMSRDVAELALQTFSRCIKKKPENFEDEKTIICYGGEPLLNFSVLRDVFERVQEMKKEGELPKSTVISMNSNGTLIDREIAKTLKEFKVALAISLDGDQWANDSCRLYKGGKPTFKDVSRGLKICQDVGVDVGISCTLNLESIRNFERTLDMIVEDFKVKSLGFNIVLSNKEYPLEENYDREATEKIIEAFQIFRRLGIQEDRIMRKVESFSNGQVYPFDCGAAGGGQFVVAPNGQIGICHGYLGTGKYFSSHVSNSEFNPSLDSVFQEWSKRSPLNIERCFTCPALGICGGGCPMYAEDLKGNIWELDRRFCIHAKTILDWLIWDLFAGGKNQPEA
jgi:uncharacterized protein